LRLLEAIELQLALRFEEGFALKSIQSISKVPTEANPLLTHKESKFIASQLQDGEDGNLSQSAELGEISQGTMLNLSFPAGAPIDVCPLGKGFTSNVTHNVCLSLVEKQVGQLPLLYAGKSADEQPCPQISKLKAGLALLTGSASLVLHTGNAPQQS